jgi:hypothetical protein
VNNTRSSVGPNVDEGLENAQRASKYIGLLRAQGYGEITSTVW